MKFSKYAGKCWMYFYYAWLRVLLRLRPAHRGRYAVDLPRIEGYIPDRHDSPILFFVAADGGYFERFGRSFIGSLSTHHDGAAVHVHLYNPEQRQLDALRQLAGSGLPLSYTWEQVDLRVIPKRRRGRYYYSMRFVRLEQVMRQAGTDCVCLDIDTLLVRPAKTLLAVLHDYDVAFYSRFERFGIDTKLLAGTLFIRQNTMATQLLSTIAATISRFVHSGQLLNKLDQIVIFDAFSRFKRHHPALRFRSLDESVIDTNFTDRGIVWYPKGQSKNDALYEEKRRQYSALL